MVRKVNAGAGTKVILLFKSFPHTTRTAISELVDNSVQSYLNNKRLLKKSKSNYKLKISIEINRGNLTVTDNAAGIADNKLEHAFEIANMPTDKYSETSLNEFGFGMKGAAYWFCDVWTVQTKAINENVIKTIKCDSKKIIQDDNAQVNVIEQKTNIKGSFTQITLKNIDKHISSHAAVMEELSSCHRKFLENDEIEIRYIVGQSKDEKLKFEYPKIRKEIPYKTYREWIERFKDSFHTKAAKAAKPKPVTWEIDIGKINFGGDKNYFATGWIAKMEVSKRSINGLYYIRRKKIMTRGAQRGMRYFPKPLFSDGYDGSQMANIIYGEIEFSDHVPSTIDKTGLDFTEREMTEFHEKLYDVIKNTKVPGTQINLINQLVLQDVRFQELFAWEKDVQKGDTDTSLKDHTKNQKNHGLKQAAKSIKVNDDDPRFKPNVVGKFKQYPGESVKLDKEIETVKIGRKTYKFVTELGFSDKYVDPWLNYKMDHKKSIVEIRINMHHPFIVEYFVVNGVTNQQMVLKGLRLMAGYIVVSEIDALNEKLVKKAFEVRSNLNKILEKLPPSEKRERYSE